MKRPFFQGNREPAKSPSKLPAPHRRLYMNPEHYYPDEGLIDAVNVALILGQPLLLTGEPGTGKTFLAHYLAWELGYGEVLTFETKSTSQSSDLFYSYDALTHFRHTQTGVERPIEFYISLNALGKAILRSRPEEEYTRFQKLEESESYEPRRSVVLIDEIDKAPRDFPNDILNEIDQNFFRVKEMGNLEIKADSEFAPVVVMTSNTEKDLPEPFLRRCVFYHIKFPGFEQLERIVMGRLGERAGASEAFYDTALDLFFAIRENDSLRKKPATAELLDWISVLLHEAGDTENPLNSNPDIALDTLTSLVKTAEDMDQATAVVQQWIDRRANGSKDQ